MEVNLTRSDREVRFMSRPALVVVDNDDFRAGVSGFDAN